MIGPNKWIGVGGLLACCPEITRCIYEHEARRKLWILMRLHVKRKEEEEEEEEQDH